jgi:hypothetical protein
MAEWDLKQSKINITDKAVYNVIQNTNNHPNEIPYVWDGNNSFFLNEGSIPEKEYSAGIQF